MTDQWPYEEAEQQVRAMTQTQSDSIAELAGALAKAQGEITGARKDSDNPFFQSKYADLASCWEACRGPLSENSIAVIQTTEPNANGITVVTTLAHSSGEWIRGKLTMVPKDQSPQAYGSCLTYARRYSLAAIVGIAQVDDDAESAQPRISQQKRTKYIKAMREAALKGDSSAVLESWEELDQGEQQAIWGEFRSDERKMLKDNIAAAREALNQPDPNYIEPTEPEPREVDQNRKRKRA